MLIAIFVVWLKILFFVNSQSSKFPPPLLDSDTQAYRFIDFLVEINAA